MVRAKETPRRRAAELVQFGEAVRQQRKARGYSQEAFGDACGIDRSYMGGIERGEHNLALVNILKIIRALGMQPSEFFQALDMIESGAAATQAPGPESSEPPPAQEEPAASAKISTATHKETLKGLANLLVEEVFQQLLERGEQALFKSGDAPGARHRGQKSSMRN